MESRHCQTVPVADPFASLQQPAPRGSMPLHRRIQRLLPLLATSFACASASLPTPQLKGTVAAAYGVVERLIPRSTSHFSLSLVDRCNGVPANTPVRLVLGSWGNAVRGAVRNKER